MKPNNKDNESHAIIPESVFGSNTDVALKKPYTTKELLKSRKPFYIICGILLLLIILFSILSAAMAKKDRRSYSDYEAIAIKTKTDQLSKTDAKYYIYYYEDSCSICTTIRSDIFDYIDQLPVYPSKTHLYLFDIEHGYSKGDEAYIPETPNNPNSYIGISDSNELVIGLSPTLITVENGVVTKCDIGSNNVLKELGL